MSWLDKFFTGGYKNIASAGSLLPQETTLNFVSGATVVDNPSTGMTNVTITTSVTPGAAGQGYFTNASLAAVWATYSQDVTMSSATVGQATVQGLLTKALPSLPGSQQFLGYSGSAWNFSSALISAFGGDLSSTSTATTQYVQSLSYNNLSAGGTIAINGTASALQVAVGNTGFVFNQATQTALNTSGATFTIGAQQSVNASSTSGQSGVLAFNMGLPPGSSTTETWVSFQRNLVDTLSFGPYPGSPLIGAIWLGTSYSGANSSTANFAIAGDSVSTYMNAPNSAGQFVFRVTNVNVLTVSSPSTTATVQAAAGMSGGFSISQATQTSGGAAPANLVIQAQEQFGTDQGSAAKNTPGSVVVNFGVPFTSSHAGSEAAFVVQRNTQFYGSIQGWVGGPTSYAALYLGIGLTPAAGNYTIAVNASTGTYLNAVTGGVLLQVGGTVGAQCSASDFSAGTTGGSSLGNTAPWSDVWTHAAYHFDSSDTAPKLLQDQQTSNVATNPLIINSQSAFASATGSNRNAGTITLDTGTKVSGGTATVNIGTTNATAVNIGGSITFSAYGEGALISSSSGVITSQAVPIVSGLYALTYNEGSNTFAWTNTTTFGGGTSTGLTVAFRNLWVTR